MALVTIGSVTRPVGSDSYPPAVGTVVPYAYAQPIVDLDAQADVYGWPNLGILGDIEHLKKHGGHTPWRAGSKRGVVWAMDRTMPPGFRQWLVATCKSNYDTTWIRFFNIDGMQFDWGGNYLQPSPDHHLHLEVQDGHELRHVTLFDDYAEEIGMAVFDDADKAMLKEVHSLLRFGLRPSGAQTSDGGVPIAWIVRVAADLGADLGRIATEVDDLEESDAQLLAAVSAIQAGDPQAVATALLAVLPGPVAKATADELHARTAG